jgi:hypothetical protein
MAQTRKSRSKKASTRKVNKKMSKWTMLVKQVYTELKKKNPDATLGDAMKEASKRNKAK